MSDSLGSASIGKVCRDQQKATRRYRGSVVLHRRRCFTSTESRLESRSLSSSLLLFKHHRHDILSLSLRPFGQIVVFAAMSLRSALSSTKACNKCLVNAGRHKVPNASNRTGRTYLFGKMMGRFYLGHSVTRLKLAMNEGFSACRAGEKSCRRNKCCP